MLNALYTVVAAAPALLAAAEYERAGFLLGSGHGPQGPHALAAYRARGLCLLLVAALLLTHPWSA